MQKFTQEELIQYLYNETSSIKTAEIKAALEIDWSLREKFEVLNSAHKKLETLKLSPAQQTIDNIMNYAEKAVGELTPLA